MAVTPGFAPSEAGAFREDPGQARSGAARVGNTAAVHIDLAALASNLRIVRRLCPRSRIMAMVKANAYGHGLVPTARALAGADGLAVARLDEALALRSAGHEGRIQLLGTVLDAADLAACSRLDIDVTAHDWHSVTAISAAARQDPLRVWIKLDSGMHRMGLDPEGFMAADRLLARHPGVRELGHMTHFASADEVDPRTLDPQIEVFRACHANNPGAPASLANSAALLTRPDTRDDWVRPGIMLYGASPVSGLGGDLRPAMQLSARVVAIREIAAGESVGYNRRWTAGGKTRVATLGIGYGDGYPRHAPSGTPVWLKGREVALVGRVSMDFISVDVTQCPDVAVGDEAELWGARIPAGAVAARAETIHYALFTGISERVARQYA
jgi:alanine racemase